MLFVFIAKILKALMIYVEMFILEQTVNIDSVIINQDDA